MIESVLDATPWFWPTLAVAVVLSVILYRPVARVLGAPNVVALLLLVSLGGIAALTLTPGAFAFVPSGSVSCDLRLVPPLALERFFSLGQRSLNVLLFVPFGVSIGLLPWDRRKLLVMVGALVLPFVVEGLQYAVPWLRHACVAADVIDNLTGLIVGFLIGSAVLIVATLVSRPGGGRRAASGDRE
jgi:hypothetical protein